MTAPRDPDKAPLQDLSSTATFTVRWEHAPSDPRERVVALSQWLTCVDCGRVWLHRHPPVRVTGTVVIGRPQEPRCMSCERTHRWRSLPWWRRILTRKPKGAAAS